jgi:HemX protein
VSWLSDKNYFLIAVVLYALSTMYSVFLWRKGFRKDNRVNYFLLAAAFIFHTMAMVERGFSLQRCPVNNFYEAFMFVAWTIVTTYIVIGSWARLRFLGAFASPILLTIGVFALMPGFDHPYGPKPEFHNSWSSLHAALLLLSFGAFGLASVAGVMYLTQEHDLKFRKLRAILSLMPPIERLERVMSRLLLVGFGIYTAGLAISPMLMKDTEASVNADPVLIWSVLVWVLYLGMLVMRWRYGQGGRRFAWGTVGSFAFILLTFWGILLVSPSHN